MIRLFNLSALFLIISLPWASVFALSQQAAGSVHILKGRATATSQDGNIRSLKKGDEVFSSEIITTASRSYARLLLKDKTWIMLRPDSRFVLDKVEFKEETEEGTGFFSLLKGGFRAVTGLIANKLKYKYNTRVATIGIRGTSFMARVCDGDCYDIDPPPPDGLYLEVIDHSVTITNRSGDKTFSAGEYAYIANDATSAIELDDRPDVFIQKPIPVADPADCIQ
jgi:hypothetical protein